MNIPSSHTSSLLTSGLNIQSTAPTRTEAKIQSPTSMGATIRKTFEELRETPGPIKHILENAVPVVLYRRRERHEDPSDLADEPHDKKPLIYRALFREGYRAYLLFGETRRMIRAQIRRLARCDQKWARGIIVHAGESVEKVRMKIIEHLQTPYSALTNPLPKKDIKRERYRNRFNKHLGMRYGI